MSDVSGNGLPVPSFSRELTDSLRKELADAFIDSVGKCMRGVDRVGIMFSAGIDSALIAHTAKRFKPRLFLYSVGTEASEDIRYVERFAGKLGLDPERIIIREKDVVEFYRKVQSLLNENDFMKIELAIPVFICSLHAHQDDVKVILTGSGAEELFAGYNRHLQCFLSGGDLRKMLSDELSRLYPEGLKSAEFVASVNHCELRYPFLDTRVMELATSLKPEQNLSRQGERKRILKAVSREIGLPEEAVERPKRAMQYGSGIHKLLLHARKNNLIK